MPENRALIAVRLSNLTDESTSPERQRAVCAALCEQRGYTVAGIAEDLDVSASTTTPFERPQLGDWLRNRAYEFDVIVFWRVDRLVRRVTHLARMIEWSEEHSVNLVSATESHFDLSTPIGRALALMVGVFAEMEAAAISERTSQAFVHNFRAGKYRGGPVPWGYKPEKIDGELRLVPDSEAVTLIRRVAALIIGGDLPNTVVRHLNDEGVPTPQGKGLWRTANLIARLRSPSLLGQVLSREVTTVNGKKRYGELRVLRGDDGAPLVRSEPVIDRSTFDQVQAALDARSQGRGPYKPSTALLLRVIRCLCGQPMYLNHGRSRMYYRCASATVRTACGIRAVRQDEAEDFVIDNILGDYGDEPRMQQVYDPGSNVSQELAEVDAELSDVAGTIGTPGFRSGPARDRLVARAEALEARRETLAATPARPAGYTLVSTGQTFREHWNALDIQGRNLLLREARVELVWSGEFDLRTLWLDELRRAARGA